MLSRRSGLNRSLCQLHPSTYWITRLNNRILLLLYIFTNWRIQTKAVTHWLHRFLENCPDTSPDLTLPQASSCVQNTMPILLIQAFGWWSWHASAKNISVRAECLRQSGRAPSEPLKTPRWRITQRPASIPRIAFHIALRSPFRYTLASGLQCNGWRCENLSSRSYYIKLEERRKKVRRYDATRP